jgi:hypothetical protein
MLVAHVCMLLKFITAKFGNITIIVTIMHIWSFRCNSCGIKAM